MIKHEKNNLDFYVNNIVIEPEFEIIKLYNNSISDKLFVKDIESNYIQMFFGLKEQSKLIFNNGRYFIEIKKNNSFTLFNPNQKLPLNIEVKSGSKIIVLLITIEKFHSFFSDFAEYIAFLNSENVSKKYYSSKELTPSEEVVLNQIFTNKIHKSLKKLYLKGKILELLSLYFNFNENDDIGKCPFLEDEDNVNKIKKAKEIIIERMSNPPGLKELSIEIGLSLKKLKEGFKHIYGETVFNFLMNYKLDYSRKLLETKKYNVSEISDMIGYSTSSHYIAAFKKKFGTTPKKYLGKL